MVSVSSLNNLRKGEQPTSWKNTPTKAIRIPQIFEQQILDYAHRLDDDLDNLNDSPNRSVQNINGNLRNQLLKKIIAKIDNKESGYKSNSASKLIADLKQLIEG